MAFPVIQVDSTNGAKSDTACSGAGPATAKTGTAASSTSTTNIDITDTVDLSGVSTTGSDVIYFADTTAGHRRFARITNVTGGPSGSTWHITLDSNSPVTTTVGPVSWAIGGVRATIGGAVSALLFNNNAGAGDAMPAWTVEMQSGHTETIAATLKLNRSGSATGPITLRGNLSAATRPMITFSNNGTGIEPDGARQIVQAFELQNSNVTKTASIAIAPFSATNMTVDNVKINHATNKFWKGVVTSGVGTIVVNCDVGNTASIGVTASGSQQTVAYCYIHDCGSHGLNATGNYVPATYGNVIANCAGTAIKFDTVGTGNATSLFVVANTCDTNTTSGIDITTPSTQTVDGCGIVANNILSNNGAYGFNWSDASMTDGAIASNSCTIKGNNTYNNTSGAYHSATAGYSNTTCPWASGDSGLNPTFTAGHFTPTNASLAGLAYQQTLAV